MVHTHLPGNPLSFCLRQAVVNKIISKGGGDELLTMILKAVLRINSMSNNVPLQ